MSQKTFLLITTVIFLLMAIAHILRLVYGWSAVIGELTVPMWLSAVALIISGYLSYQGFSLAKKI